MLCSLKLKNIKKMKKILTLCLFALVFVLGSQTIIAQEKYKTLDEKVKIEAQDLQKILGLDKDQTAMIARTIFAKEKAYNDLSTDKMLDEKDAVKLRAKVDSNFKSKMMQILTEEQFAKYSTYLSNNNSKE